jgi:hypothetical protein
MVMKWLLVLLTLVAILTCKHKNPTSTDNEPQDNFKIDFRVKSTFTKPISDEWGNLIDCEILYDQVYLLSGKNITAKFYSEESNFKNYTRFSWGLSDQCHGYVKNGVYRLDIELVDQYKILQTDTFQINDTKKFERTITVPPMKSFVDGLNIVPPYPNPISSKYINFIYCNVKDFEKTNNLKIYFYHNDATPALKSVETLDTSQYYSGLCFWDCSDDDFNKTPGLYFVVYAINNIYSGYSTFIMN